MVREFSLCFNWLMMVIAVPDCRLLTESDYTFQILQKAKPAPSVSSGTGHVTSSASDCKFTSAAVPNAKNMVSIISHYC